MKQEEKKIITIISVIVVIGIIISIVNLTVDSSNTLAVNPQTIDSIVTQEVLLIKAEHKGFKKGIIEHSLNMKWSEFADKEHYSYVKTLKSGMKLYRLKSTDMMMEVYVLNGKIKVQSSNLILYDQTMQTLKEMDAWLISCVPASMEGDINSCKIYNFNGCNVTLRNENIGIHYMVADNTNDATNKDKIITNISLEKEYSNEYFSIKYPTSWQIVQDDSRITNSTSISVQIMEKQKNNYDFRPNINIIVSEKKRIESTVTLSNVTISQNKQTLPEYQLLAKNDNIMLSNCKGSRIEQQFTVQNYSLRSIQYMVKKQDNTTYTLTATMDANQYSTQILILKEIINSLIIK